MFTNLHEFKDYIQNQALKNNFWKKTYEIINGCSTVVYTRNETVIVFDVDTGEMIKYHE